MGNKGRGLSRAVLTLLTFLLLGVVPTAKLPSSHLVTANPTISPYSWDRGLFATVTPDNSQVHAWGMRQTAGAWGTGPVNYISGGTATTRVSADGNLSFNLMGTYCPGGACSYGAGSGYKGFVQFWNDSYNYIAFGLIHDPAASPSGTTIMIEGAANGRPVGGYWPNGAITGSNHAITVNWSPAGISYTLDGHVTLGPYPLFISNPSISFLAAGRNTGDISDVTFSNIAVNDFGGSAIPPGNPYFTYTDTITESGAGTGYNAYINSHDAGNNALSLGIQSDTGDSPSLGNPWFIWERVQNGVFSYSYIQPATHGATQITMKWWAAPTNEAVYFVGNTPIAYIPVVLNPRLFFQVEGDARLNGDSVNDAFGPVAISTNGPTWNGNTIWGPGNDPLNGTFNTSFSFHGLAATNTNGQPQNGATFVVTGTVSGLAAGHNWDSDIVSGIAMIAQYWNGQ